MSTVCSIFSQGLKLIPRAGFMPRFAGMGPNATPRVSSVGDRWWRCGSVSWARSTACATLPTGSPPAKANCGPGPARRSQALHPGLCHRPSPQRAVRGSLLSDAGSRLQSGSTVWRPAQVPLQEQTVVDRGSISSTGTAVFAAIESDLQLTWTAESLDKGFSAPPQHLSEHILDGRQLHA